MDEIKYTLPSLAPIPGQKESRGKSLPAQNKPQLVNSDSPFKRLNKNDRYLTDFADDVIRIDVGELTPMEIDLNAIMLPANAPQGRHKNPFPLTSLPHLSSAIKACINEWLNKRQSGTEAIHSDFIKYFHHVIQFIQYCVLNVRYNFEAVTRADIAKFLDAARSAGWLSVLNAQTAFERFVADCAKDERLLNSFISPYSSKHPDVRLNYEAMSKYIGIVVSRANVPPFVYKELAKLTKRPLPKNLKLEEPFVQKSTSYYKKMIRAINTLFELPEGFDRLTFYPVLPDDVSTLAAQYGTPAGRTENLSLEDAIRILKVSLNGIYKWSRGVIELGKALRQKLEEQIAKGLARGTIKNNMRAYLKSIYPAYRDRYGLPFDRLSSVFGAAQNDDAPSYTDLIQLIQTCCMVMTGMNHGRRKNEILGEGYLPYGLYFGCIKEVNGELQQYRLDIYVEKTVQDWTEFWCNKLVKDAVGVLEELHQLFRPLGTPELKGKFRSRDLDHKLFTFRPLTVKGFEDKPCGFIMTLHSKLFFELADVDKKVLDQKTHVFRRFFALIYYYRYDHRTLQALSHHLRHLNQETTRIYIEDPIIRDDADRIEALYLSENAEQDAVDAEVRGEKFLDSIKYIIAGNPASGGFAKHVLRAYTFCSRRIEFRLLDEEQQAVQLRDRFQSKGYDPRITRYGECEAGSSPSKARGKCFDPTDGRLHRENAHPELCNKCMYHFSDPIYRGTLEVDLTKLAETAANLDGDYDLAEQVAAAEEHTNLLAIVEHLKTEQERFAQKAQAVRAAVAAQKEVDNADQQQARIE